VNASNHGRRAAIKAACAVVATLITVSAIADWIGALAGPGAGVVFVLAVPVACWWIFGVREGRHPAISRRKSRGRDPEATAPLALADSNEPERIAA
jgi:hypothetical protein